MAEEVKKLGGEAGLRDYHNAVRHIFRGASDQSEYADQAVHDQTGLVTFDIDDYVDDVKDVMSRVRQNFPVLGSNGNYVGMISRRNPS